MIKAGLKPLVPDSRDFTMGALYPKLPLPEHDFVVATPLEIKDQGDSDFCTAFATTAVSEDQEMNILSPEYQFAKTKQLLGDSTAWGADLRTACKSCVVFGSLSKSFAKISLQENGREYCANWINWDKTLDAWAYLHRKQSYVAVTGWYDIFDDIRSTMWHFRDERRSVVTGCLWRYEWNQNAVISKEYSTDGVPHAFKIFGQKTIDGEPYLIAQLSNGKELGDQGLFYFPREVVNKEFTFGTFTFIDLPRETAEWRINNGTKVTDNWLTTLYKVAKSKLLAHKREFYFLLRTV
mgnify:FL=1